MRRDHSERAEYAFVKSEDAIAKDQGAADDRKHITIRVNLKQWRKLKELALRRNATLQDLGIEGYNRLLAEERLGAI